MPLKLDYLSSPLQYLKKKRFISAEAGIAYLQDYENWWNEQGREISRTVDQHGTPWLKMYDVQGKRIDKIQYPDSYWKMLAQGYEQGVLWRSFEEDSLYPFFLIGYICSFYDTGLYCPYTVSMSTAAPLFKYGSEELKSQFLKPMLEKHDNWQGATWFTEVKGGSDLGRNTETTARPHNGNWLLNGEKYFSSNIGADVAVVSAIPEGQTPSLKNLQLFLMPRYKKDGSLNYFIKRIKDKIGTRSVPTGELELKNSDAYLLSTDANGIYLIMEVLNVSRIANAIGSIALAQRALAEAYSFSQQRVAFGKKIIEHPLLEQEFRGRARELEKAGHLAWRAADLLNKVWKEKAPYSEEYHYFRFIAHLAKYWTAELAVRNAKWSIEVHGGMGILQEFEVERLLREAMILPIWEGTPHRQMLDGWKVMSAFNLHNRLIDDIKEHVSDREARGLLNLINNVLQDEPANQEKRLSSLFKKIAMLAAKGFMLKSKSKETV